MLLVAYLGIVAAVAGSYTGLPGGGPALVFFSWIIARPYLAPAGLAVGAKFLVPLLAILLVFLVGLIIGVALGYLAGQIVNGIAWLFSAADEPASRETRFALFPKASYRRAARAGAEERTKRVEGHPFGARRPRQTSDPACAIPKFELQA